MDDKRKKRSKGMGLVSTLVTLFIILKLTKVISWSWRDCEKKSVNLIN
jgi:hypothetical protein